MCECGCSMNATRYTLPAPGKAFYLVSLSAECKNCDAPPGVTIELIEPSNSMYKEYQSEDYSDGPLKLEKWSDSKGIAIVTGMRQHEFVKATMQYLTAIRPSDFDMKASDKIDANMAEVILEEMYDDSQVKPRLVEPVTAGAR